MDAVFEYASFLAALLAVATAALVWRRRESSSLATSLSLMLFGIGGWALTSALGLLVSSPAARLALNYATYPSVALSVAAAFWYFLELAGHGRLLARRTVALLCIQPAILLAVVATDPWHHLFYAQAGPDGSGGLAIETGPLYWVHVAYSYPLLLAGCVVLIRAMRRAVAGHRRLYRIALLGVMIPFVGNVVTLVLNPGAARFDLTPVLFLGTAAVWWWIERTGTESRLVPVSAKQVLAALDDAIVVLDPEGRFLDVNPSALRVFSALVGHPVAEVIGQTWTAVVGPEIAATVRREALQTLHTSAGASLDMRGTAIVDDDGHNFGTVVLIRDVTELERLRGELVEQASHDQLTGLHNRRHFDRVLAEAVRLAGAQAQPLTAMMIDIDHFKGVNDTFGHAVGDGVLARVARTILGAAGATDVVARFGGDEFVALLAGRTADDAVALAERWRTRCAALRFRADGSSFAVTISIGVAQLVPGGTPDELLRQVDGALYAAKSAGRDVVTTATRGQSRGQFPEETVRLSHTSL